MKKLIFTLSILFSTVLANAQVGCFWHEDFDPASLADSVDSYTNNASNPGWNLDQRLFVSSPNSDSAYLGNSDTVILSTTPAMNLTGMNFVMFEFDQINKVHFFDQSILEFSTDGVNWQQMQDDGFNQNVDYQGLGAFSGQASSFSTASYGAWFPGSPDTVPNNTWWMHETFDISAVAANANPFYIRFKMFDAAGDLVDTTNGWHLDNICITAAPCELVDPMVVQLAPIWNNITYNLGPFTVNDSTDDQSGIAFSYLIYSINGGPNDTVIMTVGASLYLYSGDIPAVNAGDTICYHITVVDASGCDNSASTVEHCFVASLGLSFPYCLETFDAAVLWTDTTVAPFGSSWQLGTPAFGATTGALSPPNAWDIDLTSGYLNSSECYLYSPVFSPGTTVNARLTFWQNRQTDIQGDGVTLQYSNDDGITWNRLDVAASGGGSAVNWYSGFSFNPPDSMWEGSSNGWVKSDYIFGPTNLNTGTGNFMVRFRFTSDGFGTQSGFSIDDLCFTLPEPNDPGLSTIVSPTGNAPAGTCVPVTVMIHNYGSNQLDSANVYYTYNGQQHGPFLWTGPLASGAEVQFTMPCDTIISGYHDLCAWVSLGADVNHSNDTACATLFGIPTVVIDSLHPYCDDFEGANLWFSQLNPGGNPGTVWELGTPSFGTTNSTHSGINAWDLNLTVGYTNTADVSLYTPFFEITNAFNPYLDFWINFNTETAWDGVRMEYYESQNQTWTLIPYGLLNAVNWYNQQTIICSNQPAWAGTGTQGTGGLWWNVRAEDLGQLNLINSTYVQFRFTFCTDGSVTYDGESIDDFCFAMPAPYDAGVTTILQPSFSAPADSCEPVEVTIKNFGYNPLTSVNVYYSKDDIPYGNPVTYGPYLWTGNLAAGASTTWILPVCDTVPSGAYNFCSWTEIINPLVDGNFYNDTTCTQGIGIPTIELSYTNSYCDGFDSANVGWSVEIVTPTAPVTRWELGTPAFGTTNTALSPPNAWDINLTSPYQGLAVTRLYTPYFNFLQAIDPVLSFWANFNTSLASDGVKCEFSINGGAWTQLFNTGSGSFNWYNSVACNQAAWSGNSAIVLQGNNPNGWREIIDTLPAQFSGADQVQFRFEFCSGNQFPFPSDGFSIDDFCLIVPVPLTAQPTTCHNTSNPPFIFPGQPILFDANIRNAGTTALDSVVAQLWIGANLIASDTINFSPPLLYNQSLNHVFSNSWTTAPGVWEICMVTTYPNGGTDQNPTDDTLCCTISVIDTVSVASTPYCPDFDTAPQWVTLNAFPPYAPNTSWTFGAPNVSFMTAANTGTNAWKTGPLTGNYPNNDSSALFTPAFNIQVGRTYNLSFWHKYRMEQFQDGGNVEYSTDFGGSWTVLGTGGSVSWYDSYFVTALGGSPPQPGWSIVNQLWSNPHHEICFLPQNGQLAYPVMFRFRFASDYSVNYEGWLIDDFCFEDIGPCSVSLEEMTSASGLILGQNHPNPANSMTSIEYIIPEKGKVVFNIVNLLGQTMDTPVNEEQVSGRHTVNFNTNRLSPGIYYYSLTFNKETLVKKMVITK
ncbi:MAG TPA: T9SS type A sorting domain-containing protein [Bacteroidia bacterium]|nr:T9SS type A sorting domain-containing protein [Bacteroidia bacterium]